MATEDRDLLTFTPLYPDQDEDTILERWRGWANEGLDPGEDLDAWTDTREGNMWWAHTTPGRREAARLYDLMGTEVVAASFPQWAWGGYLDDHAELRDVARLPATAADGEVSFTGDPGTVITPGTPVSVEPADPDAAAPEFETTESATIPAGPPDPNTVTVPIVAREAGSASNVGIGAITALPSPPEGVISVTNAAPIVGGTDVQSDSTLRARVLDSFTGAAVANQLYYRRIGLSEPGVGRITVIPNGLGVGTVLIIASTADGSPVSAGVRDSLQARLDPEPGLGAGEGQVGATITVDTADLLLIDVDATIEFEPGYSLEPASGMISLREVIEASVAAYVGTVEPGGEVVLSQVGGRITRLTGVHDVGGLELNGAAANVPVDTDPPQAPTLGDTSGIVEGVL